MKVQNNNTEEVTLKAEPLSLKDRLDAPKLDGNTNVDKAGGNIKSASKGSSSMGGVSSSPGGNKALTMNLTINNHFSNVKSELDVRNIAEKVASIIVGRVQDSTLNFQ